MDLDHEDFIKQRPAGSAILTRNTQGDDIWEVSFLIREDTAKIAAMKGPKVEIRSAVIVQDQVPLSGRT